MTSTLVTLLILIVAGAVSLLVEWRAGLVLFILSVVILQIELYRRKRIKVLRAKQVRDEIVERNWLWKTRWFTRD